MAECILAMESSGRVVSAALWGPDGLVDAVEAEEGSRHGAALAVIVKELLTRNYLEVKALKGVAVSVGPGSWTGLRIGLAAAKAMAWAGEISLILIPSLEALACAAASDLRSRESMRPEFVITVRDAHSEGIYPAVFKIDETCLRAERLVAEDVMKYEELTGIVDQACVKAGFGEKARGSAVVCCGDKKCMTMLDSEMLEREWTVLQDLSEVPVPTLAALAWQKHEDGDALQTPAQIHAAAPMYLRRSDPELKLERGELGKKKKR